jgi:hypothetical protein
MKTISVAFFNKYRPNTGPLCTLHYRRNAGCILSYFRHRPPAREGRCLKRDGIFISSLKILMNIHYNQPATAFGSYFMGQIDNGWGRISKSFYFYVM